LQKLANTWALIQRCGGKPRRWLKAGKRHVMRDAVTNFRLPPAVPDWPRSAPERERSVRSTGRQVTRKPHSKRLRVDISSTDFPRFDRNSNRGGESSDPVPAPQTIYYDFEHPSHVLLSVIG
jgi:hypothetical protein